MDEPKKARKQEKSPSGTLGDVMVFDMSSKPAKSKPAKKGSGVKALNPAFAQKADQDGDLEILVSERDREKLEQRHSKQAKAELDHYMHMMDKVLGSDETLRAKGHHKGGVLVELDG